MTGSTPCAPLGRTIRTVTSPAGPPATVTSSRSAAGLSIGPDWTSSTVRRPSPIGRSNRYGGSAVSRANASAAGSRTTWVDGMADMSVGHDGLEAHVAGDDLLVGLLHPLGREHLDPRLDRAAGDEVKRLDQVLDPVVRGADDLMAVGHQRQRGQ